jgi:hypothetical protein
MPPLTEPLVLVETELHHQLPARLLPEEEAVEAVRIQTWAQQGLVAVELEGYSMEPLAMEPQIQAVVVEGLRERQARLEMVVQA